MRDSLVIPPRFCGPSGSGNGGYACGRIAAHLSGPVTVTPRAGWALLGPGDEVLAGRPQCSTGPFRYAG